MVVADIANAVSAVAAMVAALGALGGVLVAIYFGRKALDEAKATLAEAKAGREAAHAEHELEMQERRQALEAEINLRRIEQMTVALTTTAELERVAMGCFDLTPAQRQQHGETVAALEVQLLARRQRLPEVAAKLGAVLVGLEAFGGPKLEELAKVAIDAVHHFGSYEQTASGARNGMKTLEELLEASSSDDQ